MKAFLRVGNLLLAQSADRGALPQIHAATAAEAQGGEFYGPDGFSEMRGRPTLVKPVETATDPELGRRLWRVSEELTGVAFPL